MPLFNPNAINKKYIPDLKTWVFLDDNNGYIYTFNWESHELKVSDSKKLPLL